MTILAGSDESPLESGAFDVPNVSSNVFDNPQGIPSTYAQFLQSWLRHRNRSFIVDDTFKDFAAVFHLSLDDYPFTDEEIGVMLAVLDDHRYVERADPNASVTRATLWKAGSNPKHPLRRKPIKGA